MSLSPSSPFRPPPPPHVLTVMYRRYRYERRRQWTFQLRVLRRLETVEVRRENRCDDPFFYENHAQHPLPFSRVPGLSSSLRSSWPTPRRSRFTRDINPFPSRPSLRRLSFRVISTCFSEEEGIGSGLRSEGACASVCVVPADGLSDLRGSLYVYVSVPWT